MTIMFEQFPDKVTLTPVTQFINSLSTQQTDIEEKFRLKSSLKSTLVEISNKKRFDLTF